MTGIEFLDDDGNVLDEPDPRPAAAAPRVLREFQRPWVGAGRAATIAALTPPALWLVATVVAVVASFRQVYAERVGSGILYVQSVDGWGRYSRRDDVSVASSGVRYGQLVCVAVAVLVVAAVLYVFGRRLATPLAIGGGSALLGCVATVWLSIRTDFEQIHAAFQRPGMLRPSVLELHYGAFLWMCLLASAIALLGCVAAVLTRRAVPADAAGASPADAPPLAPSSGSPSGPSSGSPAGPPKGLLPPASPFGAPPSGDLAAVGSFEALPAGESDVTAATAHDGIHEELLGTRNG